jgi:hypothetical protein
VRQFSRNIRFQGINKEYEQATKSQNKPYPDLNQQLKGFITFLADDLVFS